MVRLLCSSITQKRPRSKHFGMLHSLLEVQMVGLTRFELVTSSMSTRHSNQLSYNPDVLTTRLIIVADIVFVNTFFEKIAALL